MPQHSIFMVAVKAHPPRKGDQLLDVTRLGGPNDGVVEIFRALMDHLSTSYGRLHDADRQRFVSVEDVAAKGRWAFARLDVGDWGQAGRVRHVATGAVEHEHDHNSAATGSVRVLMMAPPRATAGLLIHEKVGVRSVARPVADSLRKSLKSRFPDLVFEFDTLIETNAWLEQARLEEMTVTYYDWSSDIAEANSKVPGELKATFKPSGGGLKNILRRLRGQDLRPEQLLGEAFLLAPDEAKVRVVGEDGRSKSFVLGKEGTPRITQHLSDGDPAPSDEEFRSAALRLGKEHAKRIFGEEWDNSYQSGAWTDARRQVSWGQDD